MWLSRLLGRRWGELDEHSQWQSTVELTDALILQVLNNRSRCPSALTCSLWVLRAAFLQCVFTLPRQGRPRPSISRQACWRSCPRNWTVPREQGRSV